MANQNPGEESVQIKVEPSSQQRTEENSFSRLLDILDRRSSTRKRSRAVQSAVKRARNSISGKRRKSAPMRASDRRKCEHKAQALVWKARGPAEHQWPGKDLVGPPTKTDAVQELVFAFANAAVHLVQPLTYSKWIEAWAYATKNLAQLQDINLMPRLFKDPLFPFVCTQIVPYGFFSVDATYFNEKILGQDFKHGNAEKNPSFKTRLAQLITNVVWRFMCRSCPFYTRAVIKTEGKGNQLIPFCRMTLDCACGLCNLRLYVVIRSITPNARQRIEFEIFAEPRRLMSFVPQKYTADNSGRTFIAGECGRCVVDTFIEKHQGAGTDLKTIYKHASVGIRPKLKSKGPDALPPLVDETLNGFNVLVSVMRTNHDVVGHKEESSTPNIENLLKALGLKIVTMELYFNFRTLFNEMDLAKVPYLDRGVLISLRNHDKNFVNQYMTQLMFVSRQYDSILRTDAYPNITWPPTQTGLVAPMKEELFDEDSEDDLLCAAPAIEMVSTSVEQTSNDEDLEQRFGRQMNEEPVQQTNVTVQSNPTRIIDFSELIKNQPSSQLPVTNLVSPDRNTPSPGRQMNEDLVPRASTPIIDTTASLTILRPQSLQELLDTPLGRVFVPVQTLALKGKDEMLKADDFFIAKDK